MDHRLYGLMLASALMLAMPAKPMQAQHMRETAAVILAAAAQVEWRDLRISIVCSEGNPTARVCLRSYVGRGLRRR